MQLYSSSYHWLGQQITALAVRLTGAHFHQQAETAVPLMVDMGNHDCGVHCVGGKAVYLLEGGYNLEALGESVAETFRGILGLPSTDTFDASLLYEVPDGKVQKVLSEARRIHQL